MWLHCPRGTCGSFGSVLINGPAVKTHHSDKPIQGWSLWSPPSWDILSLNPISNAIERGGGIIPFHRLSYWGTWRPTTLPRVSSSPQAEDLRPNPRLTNMRTLARAWLPDTCWKGFMNGGPYSFLSQDLKRNYFHSLKELPLDLTWPCNGILFHQVHLWPLWRGMYPVPHLLCALPKPERAPVLTKELDFSCCRPQHIGNKFPLPCWRRFPLWAEKSPSTVACSKPRIHPGLCWAGQVIHTTLTSGCCGN